MTGPTDLLFPSRLLVVKEPRYIGRQQTLAPLDDHVDGDDDEVGIGADADAEAGAGDGADGVAACCCVSSFLSARHI